MSVPVSILLLGRITRLLESRKKLLQSVGYRVHMASDLSTARHTLRQTEIDLLILCHSLPMEDRGRALALNHLCPMMRSLVLTAAEDCCRDTLLTKVREAIAVPVELASIAVTSFHAESRTGAHVR
jgi:DNA-binding NtrC family response regulator